MKYGWLMCAVMMGVMACGDPDVNIIYKEGKAPVVVSGGGVVPGTGTDLGGVTPTPTPTPTPMGSWPPSSPAALGPTTPISTTPCTLGERRSVYSDSNAGVYFSDGVMRCTAPIDSTDVSISWGHPSISNMYVRVGGDSGTWMSVMGILNESSVLPAYYADFIPVQGGATVDFFIERSTMLTELFIGFDDPSQSGEGG